ncbi:peptidase C39 [Burkholderia sp. Ax-1719]|uniref:peptidase C39 n=1 Tax=Burkholderia sp. Ax-1719 TaxID=2608334 RepID=UPI00141EF02A|nr:peptidase C39 [Burkholderia sp. Ax-1719]NIE64867.1 peptidase C39 [Burkholderia sp. Ax-1719]
MNRNLSQTGIAAGICALACAYSNGACAAESLAATQPPQPLTPAFLAAAGGSDAQPVHCEPVDDDVLAHQTGKYAGSDMISGVVLNVISQWNLPNGATATAQGALTVVTNTVNQLSASVQTSAKVTDPVAGGTTTANSGAAPSNTATGGQNVSVNGVSQVTQVAGNNNVGSNAASIDYTNSSGSGASLANVANTPSASASNANGTIRAGIAFGGNGISVTLQTPAGIATQNIMPSNTAQAGSIAQLLQVAGNNQQVANQLSLSLQTQQMSAQMIRQAGVLQALRNIR